MTKRDLTVFFGIVQLSLVNTKQYEDLQEFQTNLTSVVTIFPSLTTCGIRFHSTLNIRV